METLDGLIKALRDNDFDVRLNAATKVRSFVDTVSVLVSALMESLSQEPDCFVRCLVSSALGQLGRAAGIAVPALAKAMSTDAHEIVREYAASALGSICSSELSVAIPALAEVLSKQVDLSIRYKSTVVLGI